MQTVMTGETGLAEAHARLGFSLLQSSQPGRAAGHFRQAAAHRPADAIAHNNLGMALAHAGDAHEAAAAFRAALRLDPSYAWAHVNLGMALLSLGAYAEGWQEYEWRWRMPTMRNAANRFSQPRWRGEPAAGKTLLIHAEQGFGDTLQFCRYAMLAVARGLNVVLEVQAPLVRLLQTLPCPVHVVRTGAPLPPFHLQCPMLSLPLALQTGIGSVPAASCYLRADPARPSPPQRLVDSGLRRVGLAWRGNPAAGGPGAATIDCRRSMPAALLRPLTRLPGIRLVSLQKDGGKEAASLGMQDCMAAVGDFADTAALIQTLDVVLSVDTAVAHLAAALGKPVWLMDRFAPCWRWLGGRRDSPWYPTLTIYRQPGPGDWAAVIAQVSRDLEA